MALVRQVQAAVADAAQRFAHRPPGPLAVVVISRQRLFLVDAGELVQSYPVSTSRYGTGNRENSLQTPLGVHCVREKIGEGARPGTIFRGRVDTGQCAAIVSEPRRCEEDFITTRILWLDGQEPGINQGAGVDSFARYIYIHGTPEEGLIGQPVSKGCIRMRNCDVIALYDRLARGSLVAIVA